MKRRLIPGMSVFLLGFSVLGAGHAAGDPRAGEAKAQTCLGCHGLPSYTNVYPTYHVPKLGGQHPEYLVSALKAYKNGDRAHATMQAQASSLSDQDMEDVAAYLSSKK
jgi:cytochrome c553